MGHSTSVREPIYERKTQKRYVYINIKGKENPKDLKMVKLEMIFFKTVYAQVTKLLNFSGSLKEWDNQSQSFKGNNSILISKNKILFDLKNQYQKLAEDWEYEGRAWSPVELSQCFDEVQTRKEEIKSLSLVQMIDSLMDKFTHKERYKDEAYMNYGFPTIKRITPTKQQLYSRVSWINTKVNETFRKICDHLGITSRVTWGLARSSYISKMIDEGFHTL